MAEEMAKPVCGANRSDVEYDLPLHIGAVFLVFVASALGAGFPVVAKKVKWMKIPPRIFFACKHFGTGVLIATAFVHLLPTAFFSLSNPCLPDLFIKDYPPLPGVIMMGSLFALFCIEMYLNAKTGGHSHGGPTGEDVGHGAHHGANTHHHHHQNIGVAISAPQPPPRPPRYDIEEFEADDVAFQKRMAQRMYEEEHKTAARRNPFADPDEKRNPYDGGVAAATAPAEVAAPYSEMPAWFVVFYEQYVRQRLEMINMIRAGQPTSAAAVAAPTMMAQEKRRTLTTTTTTTDAPADASWFRDAEGNWTDPAVYRKLSLNITMLEGGILFHSVFVGMTISITNEGFVILLVAILFHQMFEGLGLGARIAAVPYPKGSVRPWVLVAAFGTTAPIGQAIGLLARNSYDPESAFGLVIVGVFNAISSGLLIYAALVDLLVEDFLSEEAQRVMTTKMRISAFSYVLLGALGMSIVGAFA